jgi:hypothetical protein
MAAPNSHRPAKITAEHLEEAARLRKLWKDRCTETQEAFAASHDVGTQGAVWRFLHGKDPLSLKAARGFAEGLHCQIADFSPRLAGELAQFLPYMSFISAEGLTAEEVLLLDAFRKLDPKERPLVLRAVGVHVPLDHDPLESLLGKASTGKPHHPTRKKQSR